MKILIVTGIFPPDIGGPATYVPEIAKALQQRGHQVTVVTSAEPEHLNFDDGQHPFPVHRVNRRTNLLIRSFQIIKTIFHHIKKADLVFANGFFVETTLASRLAGKPMVQKIVGDPAWERARNRGWTTDSFETFQATRYGLKLEALKKLRSFAAHQTERIIVPSRYLSQWVRKWGIPDERLTVIYNSVQVPSAIEPAPVPVTCPIKIATVGRLVSWKCVDSIIAAVGRMEDVGLVICGDGPERDNLSKLTKALGLSDRVYFAGQRSRSETLALMAACDIFILNSTYEGLPHVILEAISLKLPVITTAVGGIPELVRDGETGFLIEPGDVKGLEKTIRQLVESYEILQKMRENTRRFAGEFAFPNMVNLTERILRAVIKQSPSM